MDVIEPDNQANKIILNLPATVECYTPNVYGDVIEKALPTEAEWEFAAHGGLDGAEYVWGQEFTPLAG